MNYNFPIWFIESMKGHLEELHNEMNKDELIQIERANFDLLLRIFIRGLDKEKRAQFLQLEELWIQLEGLEKEWIFKRGLKDGVRLMISLLR